MAAAAEWKAVAGMAAATGQFEECECGCVKVAVAGASEDDPVPSDDGATRLAAAAEPLMRRRRAMCSDLGAVAHCHHDHALCIGHGLKELLLREVWKATHEHWQTRQRRTIQNLHRYRELQRPCWNLPR
jgi:hypothetical protein